MSQHNDNKLPEIRFKRFEGAWEELTLGRAASFRRGSFPQPYGLKKWYGGRGAMPFVQVVDVSKNLSLVEKTKQQISRAAQPKSVFVEQGSVVVTLQGSIGRVAVLQYDAYVDRTLLIFSEYTYETNTHFWAYLTQRKFDIEKQWAPGGTIKTITKEALSAFKVVFPEFKEQTQIGSYLKSLDRMIGLHQRKHDKLVTLKQAMLQKMFPQDGATTPEIRFKGFEGGWEAKLLGEVTSITSASRVHKNEWTKSGVPFFRSSDVVAKYKGKANEKAFISFDLYKSLSEKGGRLEKGDILVTGGGSIGIPYQVESDAPLYSKDADLLWLKIGQEIESDFLYTFLSSGMFRKYIKSISHIGTIAHYTVVQANSTPIAIPTIHEQQRIGTYFRNLNEFISKHTTQLEKLKNIKAACLDKMFV